MEQTIKEFCFETSFLLKTSGKEFGIVYVDRMMEFYRRFKYNSSVTRKFGPFSSGFGGDFFDYVIRCLDGHDHKTTAADKRGKMYTMEYEKNFKDFIEFYRS
jgi:hypothetical protein